MLQLFLLVLPLSLSHAASPFVVSETVDRHGWIEPLTLSEVVAKADQWDNNPAVSAPHHSSLLANGLRATGFKFQAFADYYGQRIRGFLVPQETASYTFWMEGDNAGQLWLSSDSTEGAKSKIIDMTQYVLGSYQYEMRAEQKSAPISLTAGAVYYLEIIHKEGTGGDGISIAWSKDATHSPTAADIIPASVMSSWSKGVEYVEMYGPSRTLDRDYWEGVGGISVASFTSSANYPDNPTGSDIVADGAIFRHWVTQRLAGSVGAYGQRIHGFIAPPQSGQYTFTISCDAEASLRLSSDSNPQNAMEICAETVPAAQGQYPTGTAKSSPQDLVVGQLYYFEIFHVSTGNTDHLSVAWRTDDQVPTDSDIIPASALHAYSLGAPVTATTTTSSTSSSSTSTTSSTSSTTASTTSSSSTTSRTTSSTSTSVTSSSTSSSTLTSSSTTTSSSSSSSSSSTSRSTTSSTSSTTSTSTWTSTSSSSSSSSSSVSTTSSSTSSTTSSTTSSSTSSTTSSSTSSTTMSSTSSTTLSSTSSTTLSSTSSTTLSSTSSTSTSTTSSSTTSTSSSMSTSTSTSTSTSVTTTTTSTTSATGTTVPTQPALATEIATQIREVASALLASLAGGEETELVHENAETVVVVKRAGYVGLNATGESWDVSFGDVQVVLPLENFAQLLLPGEEAGLSAASLGSLSDFNSAEQDTEVLGLIEVTLFAIAPGGTVRTLTASTLAAPVELHMGVPNTLGTACAYWDERSDDWSDFGVAAKADSGGNLTCVVKHLSLFGAIFKGIVNTFLCSQASLLTPEGIRSLYEDGFSWLWMFGTSIFLTCLGFLLLIFIAACYMDEYSARSRSAPHVHCLIPLGEPPDKEEGEEEADLAGCEMMHTTSITAEQELPTWKKGLGATCGVLAVMVACIPWRDIKEALAEAFDDAMSSWLEYFGEVKGILVEIFDALDCWSCTVQCNCVAVCNSLLYTTVIGLSTRLTAFHLFIHPDAVTFVMEDEILCELLSKAKRVEWADTPSRRGQKEWSSRQVCTPPKQTVHDQRTTDKSWESWKLLHDEVSEVVTASVDQYWKLSVAAMVRRLFMVVHPFTQVFVFDLFSSCRARAFALSLTHVLKMLLVTLFLEVEGTTKATQSSECGDNEDSEELAFKLGRFATVSVCTALAANVPLALLESIRSVGLRHVEHVGSKEWYWVLRVWRTQRVIYYSVGGLLLLFGIFFILVFHANVSAGDHEEWAICWALICAQDFILAPLLQAAAPPLLERLLYRMVGRGAQHDRDTLLKKVKIHLYGKTNLMLPLMVI